MKKLLSALMVMGLSLAVLPFGNTHVHDDACGYDAETGTGCVYEYAIMPLNSDNLGK